jgi:hypothetical protein
MGYHIYGKPGVFKTPQEAQAAAQAKDAPEPKSTAKKASEAPEED